MNSSADAESLERIWRWCRLGQTDCDTALFGGCTVCAPRQSRRARPSRASCLLCERQEGRAPAATAMTAGACVYQRIQSGQAAHHATLKLEGDSIVVKCTRE